MADNNPTELMAKCPICDESIPIGTQICPYCKEDISFQSTDTDKVSDNFIECKNIRCPFCDEIIEANTVICPHCHETITTEELSTNIEEKDSVSTKKKFWIPILIIVGVFILGAIALYLKPVIAITGFSKSNDDCAAVPIHNNTLEDNDISSLIENKDDVLSLVQYDDLFIPRSTEVGLLFRKAVIYDEYVEEQNIKYTAYAEPKEYLDVYIEAVSNNVNRIYQKEFSREEIKHRRDEVFARHMQNNANSTIDADNDGYYKQAFNNCKLNFDEYFKSFLVYDFICLNWNYRDVDKIEDLYSLFTGEDYCNYYRDFVAHVEWGGENYILERDALLDNWNEAHQQKNVDYLDGLYADSVLYHQNQCSSQQVINSKTDLFEKHPFYYQEISEETHNELSDKEILLNFKKKVWLSYPDGQPKECSAYLILKETVEGWKIIAENDNANVSH